jgi:hypothetical protein
MRARDLFDHYPTEDIHVFPVLQTMYDMGVRAQRILDPGAGRGVYGAWAREFWPDAEIVGVELREDAHPHPKYDRWITGSFLDTHVRAQLGTFDLVIGNPPYIVAEAFLRASWELMNDTAWMMQLLRISFLAGIKRQADLYKVMCPNYVYVDCKRPSFTGNGRTDAIEYAFMIWNKAVRPSTFVGDFINVKHSLLQFCTEPYR